MNSFRFSSFIFLLVCFIGPCDQEKVDPYANIILDGSIEKGLDASGLPIVYGYVKNIGEGTGYRGRIIVNANKSSNSLIVSAADISLNSGNPITHGARLYFEGVLPNIHTHNEYDFLTSEIKWERNK
jgi:hypothetical protein